MNWMLMPLRRYADFEGRSRRMEYWMFALFNVLVILAAMVLAGGLGALSSDFKTSGQVSLAVFGLVGLYFLVAFIPSLAVQVRRFHDQGKSGWFILLGFIPGVGGLILVIFMCIEGQQGANQYGDDPKQTSPV